VIPNAEDRSCCKVVVKRSGVADASSGVDAEEGWSKAVREVYDVR